MAKKSLHPLEEDRRGHEKLLIESGTTMVVYGPCCDGPEGVFLERLLGVWLELGHQVLMLTL